MRSHLENHDFIKRRQKIQLIINSYEESLTTFQTITNDLEKKYLSERKDLSEKALTEQDFTQSPRPRPGRS